MFVELIVAGSILGYFFGIFFIIPMVALMIFKLKYSDYFTVDFVKSKTVDLLFAITTKTNINLSWLFEKMQPTGKVQPEQRSKIDSNIWEFNKPLDIKA